MVIKISEGRIIDPDNYDDIMDIYIKEEKILLICKPGEKNDLTPDKVINAKGKIVVPGLIDMHVHLREPGHEYKETIQTGCLAAAKGGFTTILSMPNTNPVNDNKQITEYILNQAKKAGLTKVLPTAAISVGQKGLNLTEFGELKQAGAIALSDDGLPVVSSLLMRRALEYAKGFALLVISHCEDIELASGGSMNESALSTKLGLQGIPNAAESIMVQRDIALCELTESKLHIAHVSTLESVRAIREAKKRGVNITAETAPHYFTLTEQAVENYSTNAKMNPPLRSEKDRTAIIEALVDGTIDIIATDHAPHSPLEKNIEFDRAANGIAGLETSLSLGLKLVENQHLSLNDLIKKMSKNPAQILGFDNSLQKDNKADITIIDPELSYKVETFASRSSNSPFKGWEMKGKAVLTMVDGKIVFNELN